MLYLHSDVVYKADPANGMLEKDVDSLLEGLASLMVEHVLGLERLVDREVDGVVGVRDPWGFMLGRVRHPESPQSIPNVSVCCH